MEENCKSDGQLSLKRKENFRRWPFAKQNINELFFSRRNFARRTLVRRQIANELKNDRHVLYARRTNLEIFRRLHFAS